MLQDLLGQELSVPRSLTVHSWLGEKINLSRGQLIVIQVITPHKSVIASGQMRFTLTPGEFKKLTDLFC